jgi:hypothetical protein
VNLYSNSCRADLRRRAPEVGSAGTPIVVMAQGSRKARKTGGAPSSALERKFADGEGADGLVSRVSRQLDPLNVDIPEQARPSSGPTVGETVVKPGALL